MAAPKKRWIVEVTSADGSSATILATREQVGKYIEAYVEDDDVVRPGITVYELGKRVPIKIERNVTVTVGK